MRRECEQTSKKKTTLREKTACLIEEMGGGIGDEHTEAGPTTRWGMRHGAHGGLIRVHAVVVH